MTERSPEIVGRDNRMGHEIARVSLPEVLSALSYALDLTEGSPRGHTLRCCMIGMRLGEAVGLAEEDRSILYYALLLKDAGCSSNASRMAFLFGSDDQRIKYRMKFADWHRKLPLAIQTARNVALGRSLAMRTRHFMIIARTENVTRGLIALRCERGAEIVLQLGFPPATADAIRALDEHWDGGGYPCGKQRHEIPLLARIICLAQTFELFFTRYGLDTALRMASRRRGTWFDPQLVDLLCSWWADQAWWSSLREPGVYARVVAHEPGAAPRTVDDDGLDGIARAFADIVDAKSPSTYRHSANVADYARGMARQLGLESLEERQIYRAGLLHDIGKLGVSNRILDKPGPLTGDEWRAVVRHPLHTWEILSRVGAFVSFARTAALHHEKLDGSGYPWQLSASELDLPARILCVADIYEALTSDRPYRAALSRDHALAILRRNAGTRLCPDAVAALEAEVGVA